MQEQKKQQGSEGETGRQEKRKRKKGHMALRNNVQDLKLDLWHILKPLEYYLIDIIIDKTIKWRAKEAKIEIEEWERRTQQAKQHIYAALKTLKDKKIITYRRDKHFSYYGLNEEYFGELLIARHEKAWQERRNKIKLAVDNSKPSHESRDTESPNSLPPVTKSVTPSHEIRSSEEAEEYEIIEEKRSLKTLLKDISLKTSLKSGENGKAEGDFQSLPWRSETKKQRSQEEHERIVREQLALMKAGQLA